MRAKPGIGLRDVQGVYSGAEGDLWELVMGEQLHIGGFESSMHLATLAGISPGSKGVDLCCCNGAGMRFLVKFRQVASMTGVDATDKVIRRGEERCRALGLADRIRFVRAEVTSTGLGGAAFDFVWGEDAWCYVPDKPALIQEAARLAHSRGTIAFTDWVEGPIPLTDAEAERFLTFMKFPTFASIRDYADLLVKNGCRVKEASDTRRFAPLVDLYIQALTRQLAFDALRIFGFDEAMMGALVSEMVFMQGLAHEGKIVQGLFVAEKP